MIDITQLKILVVDDYFLARQSVTDALDDMGISKITAVVDGAAACDAIDAALAAGETFDIVFLDWNIPPPDGFEILKAYRARPEFDATAFIMFTSASDVDDVTKATDAGATGYLIKPTLKPAIVKKINEILDWLEKKRTPST